MHETAGQLDGASQLIDYRLTDWRKSFAEVRMTVSDKHLNRSFFLHGGFYTFLLDSACGYAGSFSEEGETPVLSLTLQFSTQFHAPAKEGDLLVTTGRIITEGKAIFFAEGETRTETGKLLATGTGTYKRRQRSGEDSAS